MRKKRGRLRQFIKSLCLHLISIASGWVGRRLVKMHLISMPTVYAGVVVAGLIWIAVFGCR